MPNRNLSERNIHQGFNLRIYGNQILHTAYCEGFQPIKFNLLVGTIGCQYPRIYVYIIVPITRRASSCPALALSILVSSLVNLSSSLSCRCSTNSISTVIQFAILLAEFREKKIFYCKNNFWHGPS